VGLVTATRQSSVSSLRRHHSQPGPSVDDCLPELVIKGMRLQLPIVQGGMGVGVSLAPLVGAVAAAGGLGTLSSAGLDRLVSRRLGRSLDSYAAVREEVAAAKATGGFAAINIMVALQRDYEASVRAAIDAGADAIVSGSPPSTSWWRCNGTTRRLSGRR
jgi:NAD(P)H-dependent flavin oxidoreductase YrpB (nitropropane dioxygenase family)